MYPPTGSKRWQLNWPDIVKILKGAAIAAGGAFFTFLTVEALPYLEGATGWQAAIFAGFSSAINTCRKWFADNS